MAAVKSYSIKSNSGFSLVKLDSVLDFANCKLFDEELSTLAGQHNHVLVDCQQVVDLPQDWIRAFMKLQIALKGEGKIFKLVHVNHATLANLKKEGIDSTFSIAKDVKAALVEVNITPKKTLDTEFINPFLEATIRVLSVQAKIEATPCKIYIKKVDDKFVGDISGIIGIVSDSFNGSVVISFPEKTFLQVMSSMLGEVFTKLDQDIIDGAGELTNMIFGQAKIVLNNKGYGIKTALPSVVTGKDHSLSAMTKGPIVVVPFDSLAGKFFVEICLST